MNSSSRASIPSRIHFHPKRHVWPVALELGLLIFSKDFKEDYKRLSEFTAEHIKGNSKHHFYEGKCIHFFTEMFEYVMDLEIEFEKLIVMYRKRVFMLALPFHRKDSLKGYGLQFFGQQIDGCCLNKAF